MEDVKFLLNTDWVINEPIDFEHKKYVLFGFLKKIDNLLSQNKLYPTFIELSLHLASLQTLFKEDVLLYTDKTFKSFDDEILLRELKAKEIPVFSIEEKNELHKIIQFSTNKVLDYFNIYKSYWSLIYDSISISVKRNKKNLDLNCGFLLYQDKKTNEIYVWEYKIKKFVPDIEEYYNDLNLIYKGDKKEFKLNDILEKNSTFTSNIKSLPVFNVKTDSEYPLFETLLPVFKRKMISYILQTVKLSLLKNIE